MKKNKGFLYLILAILCVWMPLFMGAWNKDKPSSSTSLRSSNPEILANWSALETSFGNEHEFSTGGTNSGDHTQGSARSFSQATAPATQIDGGAFASTDLGSLWVDTDDNAFYMLTATTPTWTPVSTEVIATMLGSARVFGSTLGVTGNFAVNTNKFTVAAATGNAAGAGTLDVAGNIDPTTYETTNGGFLDEDAMGSDAANKVASQQSIKKYVDDQIDATVGSGAFNPLSESGATGSNGVTIFANGFRIARGSESVLTGAEDTISPTGFTAVYKAFAIVREDNNTDRFEAKIGNYSGATFTIRNTQTLTLIFDWIAIGY